MCATDWVCHTAPELYKGLVTWSYLDDVWVAFASHFLMWECDNFPTILLLLLSNLVVQINALIFYIDFQLANLMPANNSIFCRNHSVNLLRSQNSLYLILLNSTGLVSCTSHIRFVSGCFRFYFRFAFGFLADFQWDPTSS